MLLEALDAEALFTLVGGLKPMSSALLTEERRYSLNTRNPDLKRMEEFRTIAHAWTCAGEIWADVAAFAGVVNENGRAS